MRAAHVEDREIEEVEGTIRDLEAYLGRFGFLWLAACAVYPRLYFPLTVLLGRRLAEAVGRRAPDEDEHLALCRLPWFRDGWMPEGLRLALVQRIPRVLRPVVRRTIEEILGEARRAERFDPEAKDTLRFARPDSDWSRWLTGWLHSEAPPDLQRDAIFVSYMMGRVPNERGLALDRRLARLFGPRLATSLDLRTGVGAVAAVGATLVIFLWGGPAIERWLATQETEIVVEAAEELPRRIDCADCPEIVRLSGGTFLMGSPLDEAGRWDDEGPQQRPVTVPPFWIGRHEVTVGQFRTFVEATGHDPTGCFTWTGSDWQFDDARSWREPGFAQDDTHPVTCVSWDDAQAYVEWLSKETGEVYRLPSEAEREYATRAGTTTPYWWGEDVNDACDFANVADRAAERENPDLAVVDCDDDHPFTAPVGTFAPNPFGLHDMTGNVWEWVEDCWHRDYSGAPQDGSAWLEGGGGDCALRVVRGGSWNVDPRLLRAAVRYGIERVVRDDLLGFRVSRALTP